MSNPTTEIPETTLEKIRRLLIIAEQSEHEGERANALSRATSLMAKWGLERAMLGATDPTTDKVVNRMVTIEEGSWSKQRAYLVYYIAEAMRCKPLMRSQKDEEGRLQVHVFGYESDIERTEVMYTSLLLQMASERTRLVTPYGENARAFRRAWMGGFIIRVAERITEAENYAKAEAQAEGTGTDLVLLDRNAVVKRSFDDEYPKIRKTNVSYGGSGYGAGHEAGNRANIGGTHVGGAARLGIGR